MADDSEEMSEVVRDPDEPEYYQAKEDDFYSQLFSQSEGEKSEQIERTKIVSDKKQKKKTKEMFSGKCGLQFLIPNWICNLFAGNISAETLQSMARILFVIFVMAIFGLAMSFLEDEWSQKTGMQVFFFSLSSLLGILGCWILVNETMKSEEEEDDAFVANVGGIGLWELKQGTNIRKSVGTVMATATRKQSTNDTAAPLAMDFLMNRLKLGDLVKEHKMLIQIGLGFIWMANVSFIAIGYLGAKKTYPGLVGNHSGQFDLKSMLGLLGMTMVTGAIVCLKRYVC